MQHAAHGIDSGEEKSEYKDVIRAALNARSG